jgi:hypothetical protein
VARLGGPAEWNCRDVVFSAVYLSVHDLPPALRDRVEEIPTRLTLTPEQIDAAIEGARAATLSLAELRSYLRGRLSATR